MRPLAFGAAVVHGFARAPRRFAVGVQGCGAVGTLFGGGWVVCLGIGCCFSCFFFTFEQFKVFNCEVVV